MRTNLLRKLIAGGALVVGATALCCAQETNWENPDRGTMVVTAGQGGALQLPQYRPAPQLHALTGELSQSQRALNEWQRQAGPRYRVGQAEITLPASR